MPDPLTHWARPGSNLHLPREQATIDSFCVCLCGVFFKMEKFMLHTLFYFSFYFVVSLAAVQCHDSVKYIHTFFFSYHLQILNPLCHHKIFSTVFVLASILFISILLFIIFFLLLILGFFFSFSNDFRWNIRLFTWEGRGI